MGKTKKQKKRAKVSTTRTLLMSRKKVEKVEDDDTASYMKMFLLFLLTEACAIFFKKNPFSFSRGYCGGAATPDVLGDPHNPAHKPLRNAHRKPKNSLNFIFQDVFEKF